jgi:hypothetical protein
MIGGGSGSTSIGGGSGSTTIGGSSGSASGSSFGSAGASGSSSGAGGGGASAGGANGSSGAGSSLDCSLKTDACPFDTGLSVACEKRFGLGLNYAWHNFGADFGGIAAWGDKGVSQGPTAFAAELGSMAAGGVSVVRWWMFPDFRGDGVTFDANGDPSGISLQAAADIDKALELAEARNLYIVLTIFSFDNFRPDHTDSGILIRGMSAMVSSATRRAKLVDNIVKPVAHAAAMSSHASHLLGWDVINEPEWAIIATNNAVNGQDFTPNSELTAIPLTDMKSLITSSLAALKSETPKALRSVGWAASKWAWAFKDITDLEFNQPHIYGWVDEYWPYTTAADQLGYPARPTVFGEFSLSSMPFVDSNSADSASYDQVLNAWFSNGYAGAWAWSYSATAQMALIKSFSDEKGCRVRF